jgi:hypothetical protein
LPRVSADLELRMGRVGNVEVRDFGSIFRSPAAGARVIDDNRQTGLRNPGEP